MKVLNLYAGIGGNRKLWRDVQVTAVEINEQIAGIYSEFFPDDKLIIGDAHQYLLEHYKEFDFIWSSPPCQTHSRMAKFQKKDHKKKYPDMSLHQQIILLREFFKGKWVVENVRPYYEPLITPTSICGRHYLWSNFRIPFFEIPSPPNFFRSTLASRKAIMEWLGMPHEYVVYYEGNHCPAQVLRNCVHPEIGLHILNCARNIITKSNSSQQELFSSNRG